MQCKDVIRRLDAFRTGELPPDHAQKIACHLSICRECTAGLQQIRAIAQRAVQMRARAPKALLEQVLAATGDRYGAVDTAAGRAWVGFDRRGITMIDLGKPEARAFEHAYRDRIGRTVRPGSLPADYAFMVRQAAAGKQARTAPIDLSGLREFEQQVLRLLRAIPRGEVRPYSWLARQVGRPKAARAVGNIMARNPIPLILPCHRVVPSSGGVGRYAFGAPLKRELLRREGVPVDALDRLARSGIRYVASRTTRIYCFPSCRDARRVKTSNQLCFHSAAEAATSGLRPCRHCRPG